MKRSEMILKLIERPIFINEDVTLHLFKTEAEVLLSYVEQLGMLPPYNENNKHYSRADADGYYWEPENGEE